MSQTKVHYKRHLAKTITYRIVGTLTTILIGIFSGLPVKWACMIGLGDLLIKPIIYYFHERFWYKFIPFGLDEKKKKVTGLTEGKQKSQPKNYDYELPKTQSPPPPKPKRLSYTKKTN